MEAQLRKTPFSQMFIDNMSCFPPEQLEKIMSMDPKGTRCHTKARFGKILETSDARNNGITIFRVKHIPVDFRDINKAGN